LIASGQSIGSYRILNKIGTGGMGAVYLAEHPLIGKKVALKVIHRELANNREVVQRFFQEAKAVTRIGNEHIIEIHDFGVTPEGDHFYIMEFLEGQTLAQLLGKASVVDVMRALHIGAQIASALAAAHAAGVIHRDLKPDNVMLTPRLGDPDFVKLLDFGLAKMFQGSGQSAVKTAAGVLLGTPQYMSPEACESRGNIDNRTDIYALGILLFQMITGVLPFDGESMGEVLVKQVTQLPPPPRGLNPSIPPSVEQIVLRCLAKSADARFPTMVALREALLDPEKYLAKSPPIAPARSLAPGEIKVDARTVMAYAEQQQKTRMGPAGGQLAPGGPPVAGPGPGGGTAAKTMIADGSLVPPRATVMPEMVQPAQPKMNTMRIATPMGYSSRPPRKMWPIVLVLALLLGLGGGAFAVAYFGRADGETPAAAGDESDPAAGSGTVAVGSDSASGSGSASDPGSGSVADPGSGSGSGSASDPGSGSVADPGPGSVPEPRPDQPPAAAMAIVVIDSAPQGAEVFGSDKKSLGTTPARLTLPISDLPQTFELRLAGYRPKTKQMIVTGNTVVQVNLDRRPAGGSTKGGGGVIENDSDGLMRPDDM
jgi:eukaryotic-like serine/threonine-protein kinase